jgi:16S rRNA (cytosine967-C5)-methyltransferase
VRQVQRLAAQTVAAVLSGASLDAALNVIWRSHRQLPASDRGAIQDISYGTLRHLGKLRAVLDQLAIKSIASSELRVLLLVALYQLEFSKAAPYAVVDHAVQGAAELGGTHLKAFANGVLRNYQRRREVLLANAGASDEGRFSYPAWWVKRLRRDFGPEAERILDTGNRHPPMTLRVNIQHGGIDDYIRRLQQAGLEARRLDNNALLLAQPVPVDRLPGFGDGDVSVQDAGAQCVAPLLDIRAGMRVLDACAAPGGKTAHALELASIDMTALDIDAVRLQRVGTNLERLGLKARLQAADAAVLDCWWDGKPFERVLLDAPCSASGVVRRHPDIKWLRRASDIAGFAAQQQRLLDALWKVVARGGKLLYVTCSIFSEEDQAGIGDFAARHPDARLLGGMPGRDGLLLPDDEHDGFYYALLQKN